MILLILASVYQLANGILFQNGRSINNVIYNASRDVEISTQYLASWNNNNGRFRNSSIHFYVSSFQLGLTYYGQAQYFLAEDYLNSSFRVLMRFDNLNEYVPSYAHAAKSSLLLTFINWGIDATVNLCFIRKRWDYKQFIK